MTLSTMIEFGTRLAILLVDQDAVAKAINEVGVFKNWVFLSGLMMNSFLVKIIGIFVLVCPFVSFAQIFDVAKEINNCLSIGQSISESKGIECAENIVKKAKRMWIYVADLDEMDDQIIHTLGKNQDKPENSRNKITLIVSCKDGANGGLRITFSGEQYLSTNNSVTYRFDKTPAENEDWDISDDGEAFFLPAPFTFLKKVLSSKRLLLRYSQVGEGYVTTEFDVSGLSPGIENFINSCSLKMP